MFASEVYRKDSLKLELSHLNEHKCNHNFEDCINPLCSYSLEVESTVHFFLHCHNFVNIRNTLLNKLNSISLDISNYSDGSLTQLILYGNPKFSFQQNSDIINTSLENIILRCSFVHFCDKTMHT